MNHNTHKKSIIIDDDDEIIIMPCKKRNNIKNYIIIDDEQTPENKSTNELSNIEKSSDKTTTKSQKELYEDIDDNLAVYKILIEPSSSHIAGLYDFHVDAYARGYINLLFNKFILKICKTRSLKSIVGDQYAYYVKTANTQFKRNTRYSNYNNENKKKYYDHARYMKQNTKWELDLQVVINILSYIYNCHHKSLITYRLFNIEVYKYIHEHFNYNFITETDYVLCDHFNDAPNIAFIIISICEYFEVFLKELNAHRVKLSWGPDLSPIAKFKKVINSDGNLSKIVEIIFDRYDKPILASNAIDCYYKFV